MIIVAVMPLDMEGSDAALVFESISVTAEHDNSACMDCPVSMYPFTLMYWLCGSHKALE